MVQIKKTKKKEGGTEKAQHPNKNLIAAALPEGGAVKLITALSTVWRR